MNTDAEEWRTIPNYPDYQVSNYGQVKTYRRHPEGKLLTGGIYNNNYRHHKLTSTDGKDKSFLTHRLVMMAFVDENPEGKQVRHLDGNPLNNHLSNLAYGTAKDNADDRARHGRTARNSGEKSGHSRLKNEDIVSIRKLWNDGMSQTNIAKIFGLSQSHISNILGGKRWAHI